VDLMHDLTRFDARRLRGLIERHLHYTGSAPARRILDHWDAILPKFVKVMPVDYRRALEQIKAARAQHAPVAATTAKGGH
jgi:glutamate synthase (NADPH) large chain